MDDSQLKRIKSGLYLATAGLLLGIGTLVLIYRSAPAPASQVNNEAAVVVEAKTERKPAAAPAVDTKTVASLEEKWGIQVVGVVLTNDAAAVQVQYAVTAPEKALLVAQTAPEVCLVNHASGQRLPMISSASAGGAPQGSRARTIARMARLAGPFPPPAGRLIAGRTYTLNIPNWGQAVQTGSQVSFVIGDREQSGLVVQ